MPKMAFNFYKIDPSCSSELPNLSEFEEQLLVKMNKLHKFYWIINLTIVKYANLVNFTIV